MKKMSKMSYMAIGLLSAAMVLYVLSILKGEVSFIDHFIFWSVPVIAIAGTLITQELPVSGMLLSWAFAMFLTALITYSGIGSLALVFSVVFIVCPLGAFESLDDDWNFCLGMLGVICVLIVAICFSAFSELKTRSEEQRSLYETQVETVVLTAVDKDKAYIKDKHIIVSGLSDCDVHDGDTVRIVLNDRKVVFYQK